MNKKVLVHAMVITWSFLLTLEASFVMPVAADPAIIRVPADYATIQEAINAANPGDTVQVAPGTYYENIVVNKTVSLIGENKSTTIIDGYWGRNVLNITADNVEIAGFTIRNGSHLIGGSAYADGIYVSSSGNTIRNNIISHNDVGIHLHSSSGNTIRNNTVSQYWVYGILLENSDGNTISDNIMHSVNIYHIGIYVRSSSDHNTISDNVISYNHYGIWVDGDENTISGNTISESQYGLFIFGGAWNDIIGNTISDNVGGIRLEQAGTNTFYHNNIIDNIGDQVIRSGLPVSSNWDNGAEGNYWSDYNGTDTNGDGIGDTNTPHQNVDNYPLIFPVVWNYSNPIPVLWQGTTYPVEISSNSTISAFKFNHANKQISFNVTGPPSTVGFCNVTIPEAFLGANETNPWQVLLDGESIGYSESENATHTFIYFTYTHSTRHVQIIGTYVTPEFPAAMILPLLIIMASIVAVLRRKLRQKAPR